MTSPINIQGGCAAPIAELHESTSDGALLDHRHQAQSLPRSQRSLSTTANQNVADADRSFGTFAARSTIESNALRATMAMPNRTLLMPGLMDAENEFAVEDDLQFGLDEVVSARDNLPIRPRAGSHLDSVLSAPLHPSPRVTYDSPNRPPELSLDAVLERSSSAVLTPRTRRVSGTVRAEEERSSLEAPSHPDSQDGEDEEAEQDVCFPMSEEVRSAEGIDFDELDAFVAEERAQLQARLAAQESHKPSRSILDEKIGYSSSSETEVKHSSLGGQSSTAETQRDYSLQFASPILIPTKTQDIYVPQLKGGPSTPAGRLTKTPSIARPLTASHLRQMERGNSAHDRFSFFTSERDDTVHAADIGGLLEDSSMTFKQLFRQDRGCWWLDVMCPTDAEMKLLAKAFGIHPLTTEDIRVQEAREKVELFKSYYFVCFKSFDHDKDSEDFLEPVNIYVVVFKQGLLSFHFAPTSHPANVRRRIRQLRDYVSVSADWISYAIIDDVTDVFMPLIHEIELDTDAIEDAVMITRESDTGDMLRRIGGCRKKVMALFRLLHGKADVIKMFAKRCNEQWDVAPKGEIGLYLGDIQDHLITMTSSLTQFEKILSRSHSNYLAQLSIHSMESNNRLNAVLGKITFIATMLVPMNLLTGLFGMNVKVPFGQPGPTLYPFFTIVGFIVVTMLCAGIFAKRSRWL